MARNLFGLEVKPANLWGTPKPERKRQLTNAQKIFCWENNSHTCHICNRRVAKQSDAEFDHKRAYSKGGTTNLGNVKIVHRQCNRLKGSKSLSETKKLLGIKSKGKHKKRRKSRRSANLFGLPTIRAPRFGGF